MKNVCLILMAITALASLPVHVNAGGIIDLGTAGNFAVLAGSTVTNTGSTVINGGDVGVSPGTAITGFATVDGGPGVIVPPYTTQAGNAVAATAESDLTTAYNQAAGLPSGANSGGGFSGVTTLTPGVYTFSSSALLSGTLVLNDEGNANAQFVFQIGSALTTASGFTVETENDGGSTMPGCTVFWQVGSSATLGTGTLFEGHILALTAITLDTGSSILDGSALAINAAVTLDDNAITNCVMSAATSVPEPSTMTLAVIGGALLALPVLGKRVMRR